MKRSHIFLNCFILLLLVTAGISCGKEDHTVPKGNYNIETDTLKADKIYDWEASRTGIADYSDMVLLYGGGRQRTTYRWQSDRLKSYVTYVDTENVEHWLFDAFLFIEFADYGTNSANVGYSTGYSLASATQDDWQRLIDYFFEKNSGIDALDAVIADAITRLGTPKEKHKVIITIPEPITRADYRDTSSSSIYWGYVDGKQLNFQNVSDRLAACKWYIDKVRAAFDAKNYQNVELAGFYWLAEKSTYTYDIIAKVGDYVHLMNYSFNWIPYYTADGYSQWKSFNFDYAYLQPNYFFNVSTPKSRLTDAYNMAAKANMGAMEVEFDDNALESNGRAYKLQDYMEVYKEKGVWENYRLAYYQSNNTVHTLKNSSNAANKALYHEFCNFVITRPTRKF